MVWGRKIASNRKTGLKPLVIMELSADVKGYRSKHLSMLRNCLDGCSIDFEGCACLQLLDDRES